MTEKNFNHLSLPELFSMEVKTQILVLNDNLLGLENKPEATEELTELMRAAHSIKGAARIVQLDAAVSLAHVMEDYFVAVQEKRITLDSTHVDILLQAVDTLLLIGDNFVNQPEASFAQNQEIASLVKAIANLGNEAKVNETLVNETIVNEDIWTQAQTNPEIPIPPSTPLSHSLTLSLPHSPLPHSLPPSLPHSPTPSLPHSLTPPLPHSPTPSLPHSLLSPKSRSQSQRRKSQSLNGFSRGIFSRSKVFGTIC